MSGNRSHKNPARRAWDVAMGDAGSTGRAVACMIAVKLPIELDTSADQDACRAIHSEWPGRGEASMCKLCNQGRLNHLGSRRNFLKGAAAAGVAAAGLNL